MPVPVPFCVDDVLHVFLLHEGEVGIDLCGMNFLEASLNLGLSGAPAYHRTVIEEEDLATLIEEGVDHLEVLVPREPREVILLLQDLPQSLEVKAVCCCICNTPMPLS